MPTPQWTATRRQLQIWLSIEEYDQLKQDAAADGRPVSNYIRKLIAEKRENARPPG